MYLYDVLFLFVDDILLCNYDDSCVKTTYSFLSNMSVMIQTTESLIHKCKNFDLKIF